ncbi:MAG: tetratricopeptide repeat protein [Hyphomonadaceae bacterium]
MKKLLTCLALTTALVVPAASAQVMVFGVGQSKECYDAALNRTVRLEIGIATCTQAINSETMTKNNRAATYVNRGVLRMRAGRYDLALSDYDRAQRLDPSKGALYLNAGAAHIYKQDYALALPALDKAIELESQDLFAAYYNRGIAREYSGDVTGAYNDFKMSLELKPGWVQAEQQLSRFTVQQ